MYVGECVDAGSGSSSSSSSSRQPLGRGSSGRGAYPKSPRSPTPQTAPSNSSGKGRLRGDTSSSSSSDPCCSGRGALPGVPEEQLRVSLPKKGLLGDGTRHKDSEGAAKASRAAAGDVALRDRSTSLLLLRSAEEAFEKSWASLMRMQQQLEQEHQPQQRLHPSRPLLGQLYPGHPADPPDVGSNAAASVGLCKVEPLSSLPQGEAYALQTPSHPQEQERESHRKERHSEVAGHSNLDGDALQEGAPPPALQWQDRPTSSSLDRGAEPEAGATEAAAATAAKATTAGQQQQGQELPPEAQHPSSRPRSVSLSLASPRNTARDSNGSFSSTGSVFRTPRSSNLSSRVSSGSMLTARSSEASSEESVHHRETTSTEATPGAAALEATTNTQAAVRRAGTEPETPEQVRAGAEALCSQSSGEKEFCSPRES
ncbi:hypothetical protein, conserved [Eimeria tenella]|uniref:Uncharacterized protein n=1 Tax=Eimeria tenella TaxID=5802 RepID=U6L9G9_EIMTE|nr:hypothetical protein, conserved [Eimeria tenella]CDJ45209.1 hypothetical protein, conserved [Eimeria tenella]|eukprot:XP_013235956.1 hypothetical protein, conserved [Eimeria tenella]